MSEQLTPGFMVIHGNRMEDLQELVIQWSRSNPLRPLEPEVVLVQSNGIAQWMQMALGADPGPGGAGGGMGIAMATDIMLPARFQWLSYRRVIEALEGAGTVPTASPFDKPQLRWRLLRLLPAKLGEPGYEPLAKFLGDDQEQRKHFQLAERLADLYDQYQVYRADWLDEWLAGRDHTISPQGVAQPLADEDRWQALLWRDIHEDVPTAARETHRAAVHRRFIEAARHLTPETLPEGLPRRVVVFGISAMPYQSLEALEALSGACQILLCTMNPCEHYWGDIVEGKALLRAEYRRQRHREGTPADIDMADLHLHAHPLLAAWGKQGRDYLHLLDERDEKDAYAGLFDRHGLRIDLFEPGATHTLLGQLQDDILQLRPAHESLNEWPAVDPANDTSIQFTIAHSPQREVEILHDQLLAAFAADPALQPRDIIVMVPDADTFSPYVHAVFGQFGYSHPRYIPYELADQRQRHHAPLLVALETLLNLPQLRVTASDVLDLLDVPALRRRFGISEADLAMLRRWIGGANIRWGLHGEHRDALSLPGDDERNSWRFGLDRMLAGFAFGDADDVDEADWEDIAPYGEVSGLDAALVGPLYQLADTLDHYWRELSTTHSVRDWVPLLSRLLEDVFQADSRQEERLLLALEAGLESWLDEADGAEFGEPLPLNIVRETWLARVDENPLSQRFLGGAVTFATLMPMRAIPFQHVYLLGMNDGDYPRAQQQMDFDIMSRPGQYRPGDRSRREDDRYLMLEALLSARKHLSISWVGRSIRDNSERAASVLVGQLRDHLAAAWRLAGDDTEHSGARLVEALTTEHPLQPFSAAYYRDGAAAAGLITYADEWEHLHHAPQDAASHAPGGNVLSEWRPETPVTLRELASFLRRPIDQLYRQRLGIFFPDQQLVSQDAEPFGYDNLEVWKQQDALLQPVGLQLALDPSLDPETLLEAAVDRRMREGEMPHEPFAGTVAEGLTAPLLSQLARYRAYLQDSPVRRDPAPEVHFAHGELLLEDSLDQVVENAAGMTSRVVLETSKLHEGDRVKWTSLIKHWPYHLALQLVTENTPSIIVGQTGDLVLDGMSAEAARDTLGQLLDTWLAGMHAPLPVTCKAAFLALDLNLWEDDSADRLKVETAFEEELEQSLTIARHYPDFASLDPDGRFRELATTLYAPLRQQVYQETN